MNAQETYPALDDLLRSLSLTGERADVECKASAWQLPDDVWETVSAFSNTAGGTLLLGVAEREGRYQVAGLLDAPRVQHDLASGLRDRMNVPVPAQVELLVVHVAGEERVLLSAYVPEAMPYQKPIYLRRGGLDRGCYKRVAGHDMPCTEEDLARYFQERSLVSADMTPVPMARREELDPKQIRALRQLLDTRDPTNPVLAYDDDDLLLAYGATVQPAGQEEALPTAAGVLVFGTPALIQRCFPAFRVDLIEVEGTEWVTAPTERGAGRAFQGPLLQVARDVLRLLRQEIPERFALRPGEAQRMADPMHVALREALHNALMHQDYRTHRPTQVRRYADRLEIENPGASLRDPERLGEPGSELRNPRIAQVFYEIGWAEIKGTGIRAMQQAMDELGLTPPTFESDPQDRAFRVTFYRHHFMDNADLAWLARYSDLELGADEQKALVYARKTGRVDNAAYRRLNHTDTLTASRALTRLESLNLLERSEQRRGPGVYYTLPDQKGSTDQAAAPVTRQVTHQITGHSERELTTLLAGRKRLSHQEMSDVIVTLCTWRPHTARELAERLHRNFKYVRDAYLAPLVREGRLERTGAANDPHVAYRAVGETEDKGKGGAR
jgi:ATP-dependent DNA helicase RecG